MSQISKRIFDIILSCLGLILLAPLFLFCGIGVFFDSPGSVFFHQERVGKGGQPFWIHKFRTMHVRTESQGQLTVAGDRRITRAGHNLRKWKLDELPQLWNVLVGEMSLVGPRPEVPQYVALYTAEQRQVLEVRPGITDLASLEFLDENAILANFPSPEEAYIGIILPRKLQLHQHYAAHASLILDAKIIAWTLAKIVSRSRSLSPHPLLDSLQPSSKSDPY